MKHNALFLFCNTNLEFEMCWNGTRLTIWDQNIWVLLCIELYFTKHLKNTILWYQLWNNWQNSTTPTIKICLLHGWIRCCSVAKSGNSEVSVRRNRNMYLKKAYSESILKLWKIQTFLTTNITIYRLKSKQQFW